MFETLFAESGLSLERLRTFIEVHERGSIAAAAPGDLSKQSQFSHQLRDLSGFFGCELTEREGKVLKLSREGMKLVDVARKFLRELEDFYSECASKRRMFTIAAGDSLIQWLLMPRLGSLLAKVKNIGFTTCNLRTRDIVHHLADSRADFGLLRGTAVQDPLKSYELGTLSYVVIVPKKLITAGRRATSIKGVLREFPIATQTTDGMFSGTLRDVAAREGLTFQPALGCQSFTQTIAAARSGEFAAVVPELAVSELPPNSIKVVRGKQLQPLERKIVLAWNGRMLGVRPQGPALLEELKIALRL